MTKLSTEVKVSRHFQRSIRIDADYGREDALQGYVFQGSAKSALVNVATHLVETKQRAFTWTGPYGGGKSSLGLALCSLVSPDEEVRTAAKNILQLPPNSPIFDAFDPGKNGWKVLPIQGSRNSVLQGISDILGMTKGKRKPSQSKIIKALVEDAESREDSGVLLVIDEMGKFLEHAAHNDEDIFFYQELAEAASRCNGKLVVVGILHQSFDQYAARLGREAQDEWQKVQGRYIDMPLVSASDELVDLIGRAITAKNPDHHLVENISKHVATVIQKNRPSMSDGLVHDIKQCWPLHPLVSVLLGPVSKRGFGQNERSIFSFLASSEPYGFQEFLQHTESNSGELYTPEDYWNYLRANFDPSILSSPDGHRWAAAIEAVERAEARGRGAEVVKTVALIEIFRNGSGLMAEPDLIVNSSTAHSKKEVQSVLDDLARWSILVFRKHLNSWGVFAGSDFDIDSAVSELHSTLSISNLGRAAESGDLPPVLAKRHYQETGAMRWMSRSILHQTEIEH